MEPPDYPPPLAGVRVLELGSSVAVPSAGRLLADFGAEVLKVEPPEGDQLRTWGAQAPDGTSWWFKAHNRNKRFLSFDLRIPEQRAVVRKLALTCDVILENFRPGRVAEWGLAYDQLSLEKPQLVYVSVSGYGQDGPYAGRAGFGNIAESMGGLRYVTGYPDRPPLRIGVSLGDELAAMYAVIGVLNALRARDRDGVGDYVDVSLVESCFSMMEATLPEFVHAGIVAERSGNRFLRAAPSSTYATKDGGWLSIGGNGQGIFRRLCAAMGRAELADDVRFSTNQNRIAHSDELDEIIESWTRTLTAKDASDLLAEAGVPAGPVMSVEEIVRDEHFVSRGTVARVPDDNGTPIATSGIVPKLRHHPGRLRAAAGAIGRDQRAVLEELGLPEEVRS